MSNYYFNPNNPNNYFANAEKVRTDEARDQANRFAQDAMKSKIDAGTNAQLASVISKKAFALHEENAKLESEKEYYKNLIAQPMHIIAEQNGDFKKTYEKQQLKIASWILSQRAYKETAYKLGIELGKGPDEIQEDYQKNLTNVLDNNTVFNNDASTSPLLESKVEEIKSKGMQM
jgi:hypothetical protein